jgi:hypothetical protein
VKNKPGAGRFAPGKYEIQLVLCQRKVEPSFASTADKYKIICVLCCTCLVLRFYRDLPYDFQTLVENVADPAHAPFAHHKVQGNRANVKYGDYEMTAISDGKNITMQYDTLFGPGKLSFCPPSRVSYVTTQPDVSP